MGCDGFNMGSVLKCQLCGADMFAGARFCSNCGAQLLVSCPFCGGDTITTGKFCIACGKELASAPKPPSDDFVYVDPGSTGMKGFFICKHQVTQEEYVSVMGNNPSDFKSYRNPVDCVKWYDCLEYCNKRSASEGLKPYYNISGDNTTCNEDADGYRLPTVAEWEFAFRGGVASKNFKYSGSNNINEVAWFKSNSGDLSHCVCTKKPNELGVYDMSGNVAEWCWDLFDTDPIERMIRGGGYNNSVEYCMSAYVDYTSPDNWYSGLGFRVVSSVVSKDSDAYYSKRHN